MKNMKWLLLVLALLLALHCSFALAEEEPTIIASGECGASGDNLIWQLDSTGILTISGEGAMKDYSSSSSTPWYSYCDSIKTVVIGDGVTSIGYYAFYGCSSLVSATIGNSVTSIGKYAFYGCSSLVSATIGNSVTSIGYSAFYGCSSLVSATIGNSVTSIGVSAFEGCDNLTGIAIPDSVTGIGQYAFNGCCSLVSATIGNSVTSIGQYAFNGCHSLVSATIGNSVTSIGYSAFKGCSSLAGIAIPDSVTSIDDSAFRDCSSLAGIAIPDSVTSIGNFAFYGCSSLVSATIGNSVTSIGYSAFYDCSSLVSATIGNSVTSIGQYAFYGCSSLTGIEIPDSVTSIDQYAFYGCSSLVSATIGNSVTSIGDFAFKECSNLVSATIGNSVTSIGNYAFSDCSSLTRISIPDSLTYIGNYGFSGCGKLMDVYAESLEGWLNMSPESLGDVYRNPMYYAENLYFNGVLAENIIIPDSVTSIGSYAFYGCDSLVSITIPDSVSSIGKGAFCDCSGLMSITIPDSVSSIGDSAFRRCSSLVSATIGNSVTSIGNFAFSDCSSLAGIEIPDSVTSIGDYAFGYCSSLASATIGNSVTSIGSYAFYSSELRNIDIPASVTSIGDYAFNEIGYTLEFILIRNSSTMTFGTKVCGNRSHIVYCYEHSDADVWAQENVTKIVYINDEDLTTAWSVALPEDEKLATGTSRTITAAIFPCLTDPEIIWNSSDPAVVSVENGTITVLSQGEATITASCGSVSDSMVISAFEPAVSFDLSETEIWIQSKTSADFTIENILPEGAKDNFVWESSDTSVLSWSSISPFSASFYAKKPGDAIVSLTSYNGLTRECLVHVCYPATAAVFDKNRYALEIGTEAQLTANVSTSTQSYVNKLVTFSSSNEAVATVNQNGVVIGRSVGTATITATAASGISAECTVAVWDSNTLLLPENLTEIRAGAFQDLSRVQCIILPSGCTSIGSLAFAGSANVMGIHMPDSVTSIADDAFEGCESLHFICQSNNAAAAYAERHGIPFVIE